MNIVESLVLSSLTLSKDDNVIVFIDDGITELMKYKKQNTDIYNDNNDILIYSLEWPLSTLISTSLLLYQPNHIVFMISTPLPSLIPIIDSIINISKCIEVVILTTSSVYEITEQIGKGDDDNIHYDSNDPYNFLYSLFDHNNLKIKHLPLYSIPIVSTTCNSNIPLDVYILVNPVCRKITPLTLHKLELWNNSKSHGRIHHINDIIGTDINVNKAHDLKTLAHQIAGVLVLELGLNTTDSIFALGKTSSLLGYNLQSYLPALMKIAQNDDDNNDDYIGIKLLKSVGIDNNINIKDLKSASLILMDRTEDLFTPSSSSGDFPIAHRIISSINRYYGRVLKVQLNDNNNFDTNVESYPLIDVNSTSSLHSTLQPSLSLHDKDLSSSLILANYSNGMKAIASQLSPKISSSKTTAADDLASNDEISSCLDKLLPKSDNHNQKYNVKTLMDNYNIIATSLAIIEANNNNDDNIEWRCSQEMKSLRELKIENLIKRGAGLDTIVPILLLFLTGKEDGPVDIAHLILQIMRVVSILPENIVDSVEMTLLSKGISDYISNNCIVEELQYLSAMQILPSLLLDDIISYRKGDKTKQYIRAEVQEIILTIVSNLIEISEIRKPPQEDRITDILGNLIDSSNDSTSSSYSVLATSIKALLDQRLYLINQSSLFRNDTLMPRPVPCFEHIETPLQKLKRTGISLLSQGLGRFGFGSVASNIITSPHPSDNKTIVIMMIGGITFKEIYEVHKIISSYRQNDVANIIIISTNILSPDDILCNILP